jgi:uncharacterized phage protein gp47/JayE
VGALIERKSYEEIVNSLLEELQRRSPITDTSVGSVARTLIEAISVELVQTYEKADEAYQSGFIDTAQGKALDNVVALLGVERKGAQYATGSIVFMRNNPVSEVVIPQGTRVSTRGVDPSQAKIFETTLTVRIPKGISEAEIPIRALTSGEEGVTDYDTITRLDSPIVGVDSVSNRKPTTVGGGRETDEELRERTKSLVLSAGRSTVDAIRNVVLALPGVRDVSIREMPFGVPGEVDVVVDGLDVDDPAVKGRLENAVNSRRPAGIQVNIKGTTKVMTSIECYVALRGDATGYETVVSELEAKIRGYLTSLGSGADIQRNRVISLMLEHPSVRDVDDIIMRSKKFDESLGMYVDDTRARDRAGDMTLDNYERVTVDEIIIYTQFTPRVVSYARIDLQVTVSLESPNVPPEGVRERIEFHTYNHIAQLKRGEPLDYDRLRNVLRNVPGVGEVHDLSLDVLYEDTGLIMTDAKRDVPVGEHQKAMLGRVEVLVI